MAYSVMPVTTEMFSVFKHDKPEGASGNYYSVHFMTLSWFQSLAEKLGEDFYAETISFSTDITMNGYGGSGSMEIIMPAGDTISVLRKTSWGDSCIVFLSRGTYSDEFVGNVISATTGEFYFKFHGPGFMTGRGYDSITNYNCFVFNINPSLKMIYGNTDYRGGAGLVFKDNLIICGDGDYPMGNNSYHWDVRIFDAANKVTLDLISGQYYGYSHSFMQLAPILYVQDGNIVELNDVFTMLESMDDLGNTYQIVRQDDILYVYHGKHSHSSAYNAILCVSNRNS